MRKGDYVWLPLLFTVLSCCYLVHSGLPLSCQWTVRWLMLTITVHLLMRLSCLVFPNQRRGPILAVALVAFFPRFVWLPTYTFCSSAAALALAAGAALISIKMYLRDGPKTGSFALLGAIMGLGMVSTAAFVQVLPWTLLPTLAACRGKRASIPGLALMTAAFGCVLAAEAGWRLEWQRILEPARGNLASHSHSVPGIVDALYLFWLILILAGLLQAVPAKEDTCRALGHSDDSGLTRNWPRSWRPATLFVWIAISGFLSTLAWGAWTQWTGLGLWRVEDLFLSQPWMLVLATVAIANVTDWIRRRRGVGNWIAEHLVEGGLALQLLANLICLLAFSAEAP